MNWMLSGIGQKIAAYLDRAEQGYEPFTPSDPIALRKTLRPGDVLLVEGNNHVSGVIKYLTQSTWSHAALYVGPIGERTAADGEPLVLVEAVLGINRLGAIAVPVNFRLTPAELALMLGIEPGGGAQAMTRGRLADLAAKFPD